VHPSYPQRAGISAKSGEAAPKNPRGRVPLVLLSALILLAVLVLAMGVGSVRLGPLVVLGSLWHGLSGTLAGTSDTIIWQIRLPRVLCAALVGAALSLSGAAYQGIFRNPLADPYLLGVASGAGLGATLALLFSASLPWLLPSVPLVSFVFALLFVALTLGLARQRGATPIVSLILAGVVLGSSATAVTSLLMLYQREDAARVLTWLLGGFGLSSWAQLASVTPPIVLSSALVLIAAQPLNILQLGEESALQLGIRVERFKLLLIVAATLSTAAAVSISGIIGFVGLIVPHALRLAFGSDYRTLLPLSLFGGAVFMVLTDLIARTLIAPAELPIGIITALIGGPFFLFLLRRRGGFKR
jgi:iron complex transport system permease protein